MAMANEVKLSVVETGGKQYIVQKGDVLDIEKLDVKEGDSVTFDKVLLIADSKGVKIGKPYLEGEKIEASIEKQGRARKVRVVHYKSKVRYHKVYGHRQPKTTVKIK